MKKVFISFVLIWFMSRGLVMAQKNIVSVEPIRVWNGLRLKYERVFGEKLTLGSQATLYYGEYPGYQIAPFVKHYFKAKAPEGWYIQGKIPLGLFWDRDDENSKQKPIFNGGFGINWGWQKFLGKKDKWSLDFTLGLKFVGPIENTDKMLGNLNWYVTGPGSLIDGLITIGYRF